MAEYNFQKELEGMVFDGDVGLDKDELIEDTFKIYVVKLFEHVLGREKENRISMDALVMMKRNLINEFRRASLDVHQKSEQQYSDLFEATVKEIFNEAAHNNSGEDIVEHKQDLIIDPEQYVNESGLYIPKNLKIPGAK